VSAAKYSRMATVDLSQEVVQALPIEGYEELTVGRILPQLEELGPFELHQVRDFESRHLNRHSVLTAIARLLG
jgi:hypothetical protein